MTRIRTMALCVAFVALSSCTTAKDDKTGVTPPTESSAATPPTEPVPATEPPTTPETEPTTPETEPPTPETEPATTEPPPVVSIDSGAWYNADGGEGGAAWTSFEICPPPSDESLRADTPIAGGEKPLPPVPVPVSFVGDELLVAGDQAAANAIGEAVAGRVTELVDGDRTMFLIDNLENLKPQDLHPFVWRVRAETEVAVDLNYLHPFLPNYRPHPASKPPTSTTTPTSLPPAGAESTVAVIDTATTDNPQSPAGLGFAQAQLAPGQSASDVAAIGNTSDVAGHGEFIAALVRRYASNAKVTLYPVGGRNLAGPNVWGVDEASIVEAIMSAAKAKPDTLSMAFGGWGCAATPHLGLATAIDKLNVSQDSIFAAAGNESHDALHFPAAFGWDGFLGEYDDSLRVQPSIFSAEAEVIASKAIDGLQSAAVPPQPVDVEALLTSLAGKVTSVGSTTANGTTSSCFSNFGDWVETWAPGSEQVSWLPPNQGHGVDGWASWDGTSFATARALAHKLDGGGHQVMPTAVVPCPPPSPSPSTSVPTP